MTKEAVYIKLEEEINNRIELLKKTLKNQQEGLHSASESTAGDKHNTSRAMMHIEIDKNSKQLSQTLQLKKLLSSVSLNKTHNEVGLGSLVKTSSTWLFIAVPFGKINVNNEDVMCISLASPIGQKLKGRSAGQQLVFNNKNLEVITIK